MRLALAFLAIAISAAPVSAHHVKVATATTDADAFAIYISEYTAQKLAIIETYRLWTAAESGAEKSSVGDELRTGLLATIGHLDSLELRACFAPFHEMTMAEFEAIADYVTHGDNPPYATALLNFAAALGTATQGQIGGTLIDCAGDVTA